MLFVFAFPGQSSSTIVPNNPECRVRCFNNTTQTTWPWLRRSSVVHLHNKREVQQRVLLHLLRLTVQVKTFMDTELVKHLQARDFAIRLQLRHLRWFLILRRYGHCSAVDDPCSRYTGEITLFPSRFGISSPSRVFYGVMM